MTPKCVATHTEHPSTPQVLSEFDSDFKSGTAVYT